MYYWLNVFAMCVDMLFMCVVFARLQRTVEGPPQQGPSRKKYETWLRMYKTLFENKNTYK